MNEDYRERLKQRVAVMQAHLDGKTIQHRPVGGNEWTIVRPDDVRCTFAPGYRYEIVSEPLHIWEVRNSDGLTHCRYHEVAGDREERAHGIAQHIGGTVRTYREVIDD